METRRFSIVFGLVCSRKRVQLFNREWKLSACRL